MRVATSVHALENMKLVPKIDNPFVCFQNSISGSDQLVTNWKFFTLTLNANFQS